MIIYAYFRYKKNKEHFAGWKIVVTNPVSRDDSATNQSKGFPLSLFEFGDRER